MLQGLSSLLCRVLLYPLLQIKQSGHEIDHSAAICRWRWERVELSPCSTMFLTDLHRDVCNFFGWGGGGGEICHIVCCVWLQRFSFGAWLMCFNSCCISANLQTVLWCYCSSKCITNIFFSVSPVFWIGNFFGPVFFNACGVVLAFELILSCTKIPWHCCMKVYWLYGTGSLRS